MVVRRRGVMLAWGSGVVLVVVVVPVVGGIGEVAWGAA